MTVSGTGSHAQTYPCRGRLRIIPKRAIECAILDGLADVLRQNVTLRIEISDCAIFDGGYFNVQIELRSVHASLNEFQIKRVDPLFCIA